MEILVHAITGCAAGSTAACGTVGFPRKIAVIAAGLIGGVMPDIDALSLAPGFDSAIGALLHLTHSGKEIFFGSFPYSHRMAMHSLTVPFAVIITGFVIMKIIRHMKEEHRSSEFAYRAAAAFGCAYTLHLFCDMVTPAGIWGGIRLLYPADLAFGGWGLRWWWNNYDITLAGFIVASVTSGLSFITAIPARIRNTAAVMILSVGIITCGFNITRGTLNYNDGRIAYCTKQNLSLTSQKKMLGNRLFLIIHRVYASVEIRTAR
ncbi:MAG TPA: metal-dependent hydrolase [Spirochaetota bacterium]|nr:metal-dependent hydrolase [Spirochaetota bacterium]